MDQSEDSQGNERMLLHKRDDFAKPYHRSGYMRMIIMIIMHRVLAVFQVLASDSAEVLILYVVLFDDFTCVQDSR